MTNKLVIYCLSPVFNNEEKATSDSFIFFEYEVSLDIWEDS